jgi:hypothetical protein
MLGQILTSNDEKIWTSSGNFYVTDKYSIKFSFIKIYRIKFKFLYKLNMIVNNIYSLILWI